MTLYDVLKLMQPDKEMPHDILRYGENILPNSSYSIKLCFMAEEETWITTYPEHPILIPLYDYPVTSIAPSGDCLEIWIDYMTWFKDHEHKQE